LQKNHKNKLSNTWKKKKIKYHSHYISNCISLKVTTQILRDLSKFAEIETIDKVDQAHLIRPEPNQKVNFVETENTKKDARVEIGVQRVKAPEVWEKLGHKGKGIVIGVIDTGAFMHDALKKTYRGGDSGDHTDHWLDATSLNRQVPYDDNVHGTHCHGTITGADDREIVGVAPESKWVSCKFLTARGGGNYADALKCYEFMLAPGGNTDKRPHVVSNSYGGGTPTDAMRRALQALMAAGVEMIFAAGNSGSSCSTVSLPAAYPEAFAVGALARNSNAITRFSSRGPSRQAPDAFKPEIMAPGGDVRSTDNRGGYRSLSGTSMACPHVAGVVALLWSGRSELVRDLEATRQILIESATELTSRWCPTVWTPRSPNNEYGYGAVDALSAYNSIAK